MPIESCARRQRVPLTSAARANELSADSKASTSLRPSDAGVVGAVVELGAIGGGLARIGALRCDGVVPLAHQSDIAVGEELHLARPAGEPVLALDLDLVAVILHELVVERQLIRQPRHEEAPGAQRPFIMEIFARQAPAVAARVGREVVGRVGGEVHAQELLPDVAGDRVAVEDVDDREVARGEHEAAALHALRELHRGRLLLRRLAAEVPGLAQKKARAVEDRRAEAGLLELAVLHRAAQAVQVGERHLRDHLRHEEQLAAAPGLGAKIAGGGGAPASLPVRRQRVGTAVQVGVSRPKCVMLVGDVGRLPKGVPALFVLRRGVHSP